MIRLPTGDQHLLCIINRHGLASQPGFDRLAASVTVAVIEGPRIDAPTPLIGKGTGNHIAGGDG